MRSYLDIPPPTRKPRTADDPALEDTAIDVDPESGSRDTLVSGRREPSEALLSRGDELGRYVVLELLGRGGMGEVYAAYDPELDRKVALKVIHAALRGSEAPEKSRARLLREAQVLAKLTHPNIVTVYDVGEWGADIFIAMEFVEGLELGAWIGEEKRRPEHVIEVFAAVAAGLCAVHDVGLAHRDVKPENILIGRNGRVKLIDFGIARIAIDPASGPVKRTRSVADALVAELSTSRLVSASLETRTGALIGTPAYMAPEQFLGGDPDSRSDQFSFSVALWEALAGERPFAGDNVADLSATVMDDERRPVPASISSHVARGLQRGLSNKPEHRFADMGDMIAAISPKQKRISRAAALAGIALASSVMAAATVFLMSSDSVRDACAAVGGDAQTLWSQQRRAAAGAAFAQSSDQNAAATWERVSRSLDDYTSQWSAARRDVCEASAVRREESTALAEKRIACLDVRLGEMRAVIALVESADTDVIETAVETTAGLSPISACSNVARLSGSPGMPSKVATAIAEVKALNRGRKIAEGLVAAKKSLALATKLGSPPGQAASHYELGRLLGRDRNYDAAVEALFEAVRFAGVANDTAGEAEAWIEIVRTVGWRQQKFTEATRWAAHALSAVRQDGSQLRLEARLRHYIGWTERTRGDHEAALASFRAAVELHHAANETGGIEALRSKSGLAATLRSLERHDEAISLQREVVGDMQKLFGADDPQLASSHSGLATSLAERKAYDQARAHFERAITLRESRVGKDDPSLAWTIRDAGKLAEKVGDFDRAQELYERALAMRSKGNGPTHPRTLQSRARVARIIGKRGDRDRAVAIQRDVVDRLRDLGDDGTPELAKALVALCTYYRVDGAIGRARAACLEAVDLLSAKPPDPRDLATALTAAGRTELDAGRVDQAAEHVEKALRIRRDYASPAQQLSETIYSVARVRLTNLETRGSVAKLLSELDALRPRLHLGEDNVSSEVDELREQIKL